MLMKQFLALIATIALSAPLVFASGNFTSSAAFPLIYQSGTWYHTGDLTAPGGVTGSNTITNLNYQWSVGSVPPSNQIYLCYSNGQYCYDVSSAPNANVPGFNGLPANTVFRFYIRGNTGSVTVYRNPYGGGTGYLFINYN